MADCTNDVDGSNYVFKHGPVETTLGCRNIQAEDRSERYTCKSPGVVLVELFDGYNCQGQTTESLDVVHGECNVYDGDGDMQGYAEEIVWEGTCQPQPSGPTDCKGLDEAACTAATPDCRFKNGKCKKGKKKKCKSYKAEQDCLDAGCSLKYKKNGNFKCK